MEMSGEQRIGAPRDKVWEALNDAEVLRQCIPGCQSLERTADNRMKAVAGIKVGPIGARFSGEVVLSELDPPNSYRITGSGQGGAAGFAKGGALVSLAEDGGETILRYDVDVQVGGRLAQLGGPIIDATAKQMTGAFFRKFSQIVVHAGEPAAAIAAPASPERATPAPATAAAAAAPRALAGAAPPAAFPVAWILAVVVALLAGVLIGAGGFTAETAWSGIATGLLIVVLAAAAFDFGRRSAQTTLVLDPQLLARLARPDEGPQA